MNKNSTQQKTRDFDSKISGFFTMLPELSAVLQRTGGCLPDQYYNLTHKRVVSLFSGFSHYIAAICKSSMLLTYLLKARGPQARLQPVIINQFALSQQHLTNIK